MKKNLPIALMFALTAIGAYADSDKCASLNSAIENSLSLSADGLGCTKPGYRVPTFDSPGCLNKTASKNSDSGSTYTFTNDSTDPSNHTAGDTKNHSFVKIVTDSSDRVIEIMEGTNSKVINRAVVDPASCKVSSLSKPESQSSITPGFCAGYPLLETKLEKKKLYSGVENEKLFLRDKKMQNAISELKKSSGATFQKPLSLRDWNGLTSLCDRFPFVVPVDQPTTTTPQAPVKKSGKL